MAATEYNNMSHDLLWLCTRAFFPFFTTPVPRILVSNRNTQETTAHSRSSAAAPEMAACNSPATLLTSQTSTPKRSVNNLPTNESAADPKPVRRLHRPASHRRAARQRKQRRNPPRKEGRQERQTGFMPANRHFWVQHLDPQDLPVHREQHRTEILQTRFEG